MQDFLIFLLQDDSEQEVTGETSIDDEPALPTPVKNFLEMLSTTPASMEEDTEEEEVRSLSAKRIIQEFLAIYVFVG